jgi:hypothetical protein
VYAVSSGGRAAAARPLLGEQIRSFTVCRCLTILFTIGLQLAFTFLSTETSCAVLCFSAESPQSAFPSIALAHRVGQFN